MKLCLRGLQSNVSRMEGGVVDMSPIGGCS